MSVHGKGAMVLRKPGRLDSKDRWKLWNDLSTNLGRSLGLHGLSLRVVGVLPFSFYKESLRCPLQYKGFSSTRVLHNSEPF